MGLRTLLPDAAEIVVLEEVPRPRALIARGDANFNELCELSAGYLCQALRTDPLQITMVYNYSQTSI